MGLYFFSSYLSVVRMTMRDIEQSLCATKQKRDKSKKYLLSQHTNSKNFNDAPRINLITFAFMHIHVEMNRCVFAFVFLGDKINIASNLYNIDIERCESYDNHDFHWSYCVPYSSVSQRDNFQANVNTKCFPHNFWFQKHIEWKIDWNLSEFTQIYRKR